MQRNCDYCGSVLYVYEKSLQAVPRDTNVKYSITYPLLYQFAFCVVVMGCTKNMDVVS